jgi:hypothetical protein
MLMFFELFGIISIGFPTTSLFYSIASHPLHELTSSDVSMRPFNISSCHKVDSIVICRLDDISGSFMAFGSLGSNVTVFHRLDDNDIVDSMPDNSRLIRGGISGGRKEDSKVSCSTDDVSSCANVRRALDGSNKVVG